MHPLQPFQQRNHHSQQVRLIERTARRLAPPQQLRQRQPVLVLHHQIGRAVGAEKLAAGNDARVGLELDQRPRFVAESPQPVLVTRPAGLAARMHRRAFPQRQLDGQVFLDGNDVAQLVVPRPIDDAEAAVPQHFLDGVIAQRRPWRQSIAPFLPVACRLHRRLALWFHTRRPRPRTCARSERPTGESASRVNVEVVIGNEPSTPRPLWGFRLFAGASAGCGQFAPGRMPKASRTLHENSRAMAAAATAANPIPIIQRRMESSALSSAKRASITA